VASGKSVATDDAVDLDFLLTDAFLLLGSHLLAGRLNPETLHAEWGVMLTPGVDLAQRLQRGVESGRIREALNGLRQPHPGYLALWTPSAPSRDRRRAAGRPCRKRLVELGAGRGDCEPPRSRLELAGDLPATRIAIGPAADGLG
jgi:hypothetical protein